MRATPVRVGLVCLGAGLFLAAAFLLCLGLGTAGISMSQVLEWLAGHNVDPGVRVILGRLRLPRLITAALVGLCLSMSGSVFQGLLRNPLADPFILGVSGGAAAGAVTAMFFGWTDTAALAGLAFLGAAASIFLVLGVARRRGRMETVTLVLTGVMVNAFFTSVIMFVISTTTDQKLQAIMFWLYGDLGGSSLKQVWILLPVTAIVGLTLTGYARHLNLIVAGDRAAAASGVRVERVKLVLSLAVGLWCGVTVSISGLIGFVGLIVPHLTRMALGHDHRMLLPASGLFGAAFMVLCDTAARTAISPSQLPVGVVTAFLGAPFFLLLLAKRGSQWW
ncbi:MAG: iron ABC transporter permease [Proteobacteria bacterium]|nr:iron ABC transporter permease [Pseudomonadota bacterium]